jgi:hypothetical protein
VVVGERVCELAGPVRRAVVDDQDRARDGWVARREGGAGEADDGREVLALVVGRQDDPGGGHGELLGVRAGEEVRW